MSTESVILRSVLRFLVCLAAAGVTQQPASPQDVDLNQQAVVETSEGTFVLSFYPEGAPGRVRLFLDLAARGEYDGTLFHRVVKWGIVQGGDPLTKDPSKKHLWGSGGMNKVPAEANEIKHERGAVSSVLLPNQPDSAGHQFFICLTPQPQIDGQFTVFAFVAEGIEVVDRLSETPVGENGTPLSPPTIKSITLRDPRPAPPEPFSDQGVDELGTYQVRLETSLGDMTVEVFPHVASENTRNFLRLAVLGIYDGTAFHGVVRDFVVQGGYLPTRRPPIPEHRMREVVRRLPSEFNETKHVRGILSMARGDDPDSAETSFFICLGDTPELDGQYTAFGRIVDGLEVLRKIEQVATEGESPTERIELIRAIAFR